MNLSEYRREMGAAHEEYAEAVQLASDRLRKRLTVAHMEFCGDDEKSVVAEDVPARYRERD